MPRPRKPIEQERWRIPEPDERVLDRDLVREFKCFMCGREAPADKPLPLVCPACGGNWLLSEEYLPRYG